MIVERIYDSINLKRKTRRDDFLSSCILFDLILLWLVENGILEARKKGKPNARTYDMTLTESINTANSSKDRTYGFTMKHNPKIPRDDTTHPKYHFLSATKNDNYLTSPTSELQRISWSTWTTILFMF
jgi:hypothetical protein